MRLPCDQRKDIPATGGDPDGMLQPAPGQGELCADCARRHGPADCAERSEADLRKFSDASEWCALYVQEGARR